MEAGETPLVTTPIIGSMPLGLRSTHFETISSLENALFRVPHPFESQIANGCKGTNPAKVIPVTAYLLEQIHLIAVGPNRGSRLGGGLTVRRFTNSTSNPIPARRHTSGGCFRETLEGKPGGETRGPDGTIPLLNPADSGEHPVRKM